MPRHHFPQPQGRIEYLTLASAALRNNCLGDPVDRVVAVYLPAGYEATTEHYPVLVDLVGYTGSGLSHVGWKAFGESVPQRIDRLIDAGEMGPVIVVLPDCFTSLGGNQYINSSVMGNWSDFLLQEVLPEIESRYRVCPGAAHRGVFGKSSGGYGSMLQGMLSGEHWGAIACHSGDMAFDLVYAHDFASTVMRLAHFEGGINGFMTHLQDCQKIASGDITCLMILAMAASYDPDPSSSYGVRLPVDMDTCELLPERWQNWLAWDPVQLIQQAPVRASLNSLAGLYIDCGAQDQYRLVFGARQLRDQLQQAGIEHRYAEFDDDHSSVDYRMDISLPYLYSKIKA